MRGGVMRGLPVYVNSLAWGGERSYFYQMFMRRKQPIPLQGSELF